MQNFGSQGHPSSLPDQSAHNIIIVMAVLGILSGLASQGWVSFSPFQAPLIYGTSVWPGIFFGLTIAYGSIKWGQVPYILSPLLVLVVCASWIAAAEFSDATFNTSFNEALAYITSGLIGSFGTALGVVIFSHVGRAAGFTLILYTMIAGASCTLAVSPLYALVGKYISWFVFPLWQAAVAAAIGYGLLVGREALEMDG